MLRLDGSVWCVGDDTGETPRFPGEYNDYLQIGGLANDTARCALRSNGEVWCATEWGAVPAVVATEVQLAIAKAAILSVLFYVLVFCRKNYAARLHNIAVNRHRVLALQTYIAFANESGKSTQAREALLLQAAQTVFGAQVTGYLPQERDPEPTTRIFEMIRGDR